MEQVEDVARQNFFFSPVDFALFQMAEILCFSC